MVEEVISLYPVNKLDYQILSNRTNPRGTRPFLYNSFMKAKLLKLGIYSLVSYGPK